MRLRHIEIFHAIYTTGSITNAANMLHVSQPSVSKVLAHAELQLGFNLFKRIKGRLIPTDEAEMLYTEVDKIYKQILALKNTTDNIKKLEFGRINLGISPALGFDVTPISIAKYHQKFSNVEFNITTIHNDSVQQALMEHKCDLAVLFAPEDMPGVKAIDLTTSELVIVYPKKLFPHCPDKLKLSEVADVEFIDITSSGPLGDIAWKRLLEEKVAPKSLIKVQTYFIAARLVAQGLGICIVDKFTAENNLTDDIAIASFDPLLNVSIKGLHLENKGLPKVVQEYIPYLTEVFASKK